MDVDTPDIEFYDDFAERDESGEFDDLFVTGKGGTEEESGNEFIVNEPTETKEDSDGDDSLIINESAETKEDSDGDDDKLIIGSGENELIQTKESTVYKLFEPEKDTPDGTSDDASEDEVSGAGEFSAFVVGASENQRDVVRAYIARLLEEIKNKK